MQPATDSYNNSAIWRIALPMMLSGISVPLLGFVDTAVMGHAGEVRWIGAVAAGSAIFTMLFMSMNFLRMGTTGITAQAYGSNDNNVMRTVLAQSTIVAALIGVSILVLREPLLTIALKLLAPEPAVAEATADYFRIRVWAAPATLINFALLGWFLGMQNARMPLVMTLTINLANIILDILFVPVLGMTIKGVAWATVIAEHLGLAAAVFMALRLMKSRPGYLMRSTLRTFTAYKQLLDVNLSLFVRTIALMFTLTFVTAQGARYGEVILAANAILLNFQLFLSYALDGVAHAAEALSGKALGGRNIDALRKVIQRTLNWSLLASAVYCVAYLVFGNAIIDLITDQQVVRDTASEYLIWMIISPLISVWCFLYDGVFVGLTRSKEMMVVMISALLFAFLPTWYLATVVGTMGNHGLWLAFTLFMAARGLGMWLHLRIVLRRPTG